jgi:omega-amidase
MRVSLVQTDLVWENPAANRNKMEQLIEPLKGYTDLVLLPEMFTTGFTMQAEQWAEDWNISPTSAWMRAQAAQLEAAVAGSYIVYDAGNYHNRLVWAYPDGRVMWYNKRHLFSLAGEHEHYSSGRQKVRIDWMGFRVCPFICYDLRFPVWSRNVGGGYDLAVYVANWPEARIDAWRTLLKARAIENQCYVVGVNIIGTDGKGLNYPGASSAFNYLGEEICYAQDHAGVFTVSLDQTALRGFREKFRFLDDQDHFELQF